MRLNVDATQVKEVKGVKKVKRISFAERFTDSTFSLRPLRQQPRDGDHAVNVNLAMS